MQELIVTLTLKIPRKDALFIKGTAMQAGLSPSEFVAKVVYEYAASTDIKQPTKTEERP